MECEPLACAPEPALNFVRDKQRAIFRGEPPRGTIEIFIERTDSAFSLDRFDQDSAHVRK